MSVFKGTKLNTRIGKTLLVLVCAFTLSACASTRTFEDAGVYKGENYSINITREDTGFSRQYLISIDGDQVLTIDRAAIKAANCQQMSFYVSRCTYDTQHEGKAVRIIQEVDGQMFQQNAYYSVYFDGVLIRRVTTPLL